MAAYLLAAAFVWGGVVMLLDALRAGHEARYLAEQSAMQNLAWEAATRMNHGMVRVYFEEYVMQPETLALLKAAQDPARRDRARQMLFERLETVNAHMQADGFRQLHFHLPNGDSLLRFHQPERYGDNLFEVRHSIKIANTQLKPVFGFEAGRIYSGFRSVFPVVTPEGEHLGSVELSMPFEAVRKEIAELMPQWEFLFVVSAAQHEAILFDSQKPLYAPWLLHGGFWVEDPWRVLPDAPKPLSPAAGCMLQDAVGHPGLTALIDRGESGAVAIAQEAGYALLALTAVRDTQHRLAGYLVGMRKTQEPQQLDISVAVGRLLAALFLAALALTLWWLHHNHLRLRQTKESLARALDAEKKFIASMSHEMRTPLNSVIGYLDLLQDEPLKAQASEFARRAHRSAHHLFALISDILDLSKLDAGQLELMLEPADVAALMHECAEMIAPNVQPGVELKVEVCPVCCTPMIDTMRLRQIFINLLGNAAKFTHAGHIRFFCEADTSEKTRIRLKFGVEDTGAGIAPQKMPELFKPFRRVHGSHYEGTGLGLYLSRTLAEHLGGELTVSSVPGEGSLFLLTLTIECCSSPECISKGYEHLRVLLIEDEPLSIELARELFLNAFGIRLEVVPGTQKALERLSAGGVDLVLAGTPDADVELLRRSFPGVAADALHKPILKEQVARLLSGFPDQGTL